MARATLEDPSKIFRFSVVIDGFQRAAFSEISGITRDTDVVEYREGGMNDTPQKSPGLTKYGNITMRRGLILGSTRGGQADFLNWCQQVHTLTTLGTANVFRKDFDINQFSALNQRVMTTRVHEAWVASYKPMSDFNGNSSDNSFEEIQVVHEGFEIVF